MIFGNNYFKMDISQRSFNCDETPTPTRFIRNCEEVGLFQELNPFEETFRIAAQTKCTTQTLPEPLSKSSNADTLDTPQVVPNSKRIEDLRNSYPIIEDDEDEIKLPNNDFLRFITEDENSLPNDDERPPENLSLVEEIQPIESQHYEPVTIPVDQLESNVVDLTEDPVLEQTFILKPESTRNGIIEEMFLESQEIMTSDSITNEFLMLNDKTDTKENTYLTTVHSDKNVIIISSKNGVVANADNSCTKIASKAIEPTESSVKQKLKRLLEPTHNNITQPTPKIIQTISLSAPTQLPPSGGELSDDKLSYSRERNRMAQKRCRLKKKEWITQLKQDTESVYNENKNLRSEIVSLKAEVAHLKTLLLAHKNCPVTLAMYQADLTNVVQSDPPIPQISTLTTKTAVTPIPCAIISSTRSRNVQMIESKANQNKKVILSSKKVPIPKLNSIHTPKSVPKLNHVEKKQSLKVLIDQNPTSIPQPIVNSPNAVNVICYNQNQPVVEITDLTYDSS